MPPATSTARPLGVTLGFFRHLIELCGGRSSLKGRTTAQVCFDYIVPLTATTELSLVDHIAADPSTAHFVRPANWYISHAWSYLFLETVDSLDIFFSQQHLSEEAVVWFCVFNNNQHRAASYPFEYWSSTFKSQLSAIGNVVMVMHPWNDPVVLRRSWCVFEVYVAVTTGARFEMAMAPDQLKLLMHDMQDANAFQNMLTLIKSEQSETTVASDRDGIFTLIKAETSFIEVDRLVFATIENWMVRTLHTHAKSIADPLDQVAAWRRLYQIYIHTCKWLQAEDVSYRIIECNQRAYGDEHEETVVVKTWPYFCQACSGQPYDMWGPPYEAALASVESVLGKSHLKTCKARANLAAVLVQANIHNERAIALLEANYSCLSKTVSANEVILLQTGTELSRAYINAHQYADAEHLLNAILSTVAQTFSEEHPITGFNKYLLAIVYAEMGRAAEALDIVEYQLAERLRRFGPDHSDTINLQGFIGHVLHRSGNFDCAKSLLQPILERVDRRTDTTSMVLVCATEAREVLGKVQCGASSIFSHTTS
ncbi:hypothetical protein ACHHYP_07812 [Achlya hypogyna]|uniref:Mbre TPR repeat protein n=1 Tax=Achlya hypogyna TaxID=1202772 RepID=A0A1V9YQC8_ACHHY|nr:hypothetical protein ACHHYP_07812 [Achlya hypogyna]